MDIDEQLRAQSKILLQKLKARQGRLQNIVGSQDSLNQTDKEANNRDHENCNQTNPKQELLKTKPNLSNASTSQCSHFDASTSVVKPKGQRSVARYKLSNNILQSEGKFEPKVIAANPKVQNGDVNFNVNDEKENSPSKEIHVAEIKSNRRIMDDKQKKPDSASSANSRTPLSVRNHRKIIDKNVRVDNPLNDSDCDERSRLNFSYSKFNESDFLRSESVDMPEDLDDILLKESREPEKDQNEAGDSAGDSFGYQDHLQAMGNDRKVANFVRETSKPKSILLESGPKSLKKSLNKVSFLSSHNSSTGSGLSGFGEQRQLLGYDWIAALLDNKRGVLDESEGYFEELREFRRINRDECVNRHYMQGAESLLEERDKEPPTIAEALSDTKVKPYTVNDRLFTKPLKKALFESDDTSEEIYPERKPTFEEPRFVRVSIPRSTLLSPHRVKPHRRNSIENTDSFSLSTHCVKGYETSVPSMVPAASNVGLRDASSGIKSKMQTTLADAEKIAASFPYPWTSSSISSMRQQTIRDRDESALYKSYKDMTIPTSLRFCGQDRQRDESLNKATEDLLNSTYSLMYEMEKIKQQRDLCNSRTLGHVA